MEPIVHAIIPMLILLALFPKLEKKYIFYLLPIVWIIDLDIYIPSMHRYLLGNIFFVLLLAGIAYWLWDKKASLVALFYGVSHLVLDSSYPGTAWLWPLIDKTFYLTASVQRNSQWLTDFGIHSLSRADHLTVTESITTSTYFGETAALFLVLIVIVLIFKYKESN
tara:strand:+ start:2503 stop:3000 length:498 start_codon:yes stop_codon:yes gene_type:complete